MKNFENTEIEEITDQEERIKLRYSYFLNELSEQTKSEFIDNEIVIHSPAMKKHIDTSLFIVSLLKQYVDKNKLGFVGQEKTLIKMLDSTNSYEPDVCFFKTDKSKHFKRETVIFPPPDLAVEILSKSSIKRDRVQKFKDYSNNNVEEYWIVDTNNFKVEQYYLLEKGKYELVKIHETGDIIKSSSVKGFNVPVEAMFFNEPNYDYLYGPYIKEIEIRKKQLAKKEREIENQNQEIKSQNQEIKNQNQEIKSQNQEIKSQKQELENKDQEIENQNEEIKNQKEELGNKEQELKNKNEEIKLQKQEIELQKIESKKQIVETIKLMKKLGINNESIMKTTNLSIQDIEAII